MKEIASSLSIFMCFVLISILSLSGHPLTSASAESGETVSWALTHSVHPKVAWASVAQVWVDRIKKESNGRIEITIYPHGKLTGGNQQKEVELVQSGDIQAGIIPVAILTTQEPRFNITALPFAVANYAVGNKILAGPEGKKLLAYLEPKGLKGIAVASAGFRQFVGRTNPLLKPEDFKNVKIRVMPGKLSSLIFKELGADPIVMNYGDVYTALQMKALDAIELPPAFIYSGKFYEVTKHIMICNYHYQAVVVCANKEAWDKLSPQDQSLIQGIADELFAKQRLDVEADDLEALEKMKNYGLDIYHLNAEQLEAFRKKMQPVYDYYEKEYGSAVTDFLKASKAAQ